MLLGSLFAGMAFANSPVGAVHALAYPVGSLFHVPHGLSNSLVLPHVVRFNQEGPTSMENRVDAAMCYKEVLGIVGSFNSVESHTGGGTNLADAFASLAVDLEVPTRLSEVGITESDLDLLAVEAMKQGRLLPNNPRDVEYSNARDIYGAAL